MGNPVYHEDSVSLVNVGGAVLPLKSQYVHDKTLLSPNYVMIMFVKIVVYKPVVPLI